MPITITLKEFKAGTQHPLTSRYASHLTMVDGFLADDYVDLEEDPEGERMMETLELLLDSIRDWIDQGNGLRHRREHQQLTRLSLRRRPSRCRMNS